LNYKLDLGIQVRKALYIVTLIYSLFITDSTLPSLSDKLSPFVVLYYLLFPGYYILELFGEDYPVLNKLLYSILLGFTFVASISSISQLPGLSAALQINFVVPIFTLFLTLIDFLRKRHVTTR
jgi:ABC-type Na+ efflux pump permease subunit